MTSNKTNKRALFSSVVALLLCFTMLLGTTFAWFTDSAATANNVIVAGNLDIEVEYTLDGTTWNDLDGAADLFRKGLWEPGHTEVVALKISNKGSLALKYTASMNIVKETIGKNSENGDIKLSDILNVSTLTQQANAIGDITVDLAFNGENSVAYEKTAPFKSASVIGTEKELFAGDEHYLIVKVDMPENVGNEANHNGTDAPEITFGINILATQYTYENDTFGDQYDADAENPVVVSTATELMDALNEGKAVTLACDIALDSATAINEKVNIDLNSKTLFTNGLELKNGGTVKNGNIESINNTSMVPHLKLYGGNYTIENTTIVVDKYLNYYAQGNRNYAEYTGVDVTNADVVLNNCDVIVRSDTVYTWTYLYGITVAEGKLTMNNGSVTLESAGAVIEDVRPAVSAMGNGEVTMNNVTVNGSNGYLTLGNLILNTTDTTVTDADFIYYDTAHTFTINYIQ